LVRCRMNSFKPRPARLLSSGAPGTAKKRLRVSQWLCM
jgi:hypothetical protein